MASKEEEGTSALKVRVLDLILLGLVTLLGFDVLGAEEGGEDLEETAEIVGLLEGVFGFEAKLGLVEPVASSEELLVALGEFEVDNGAIVQLLSAGGVRTSI